METFIFWITIFCLGAAHALEPGHGKLLVTSYLTGSQAKLKDAFILGIVVAVFHTLSVAFLGMFVVFLAMTVFKDKALHYMEILSGLVILGLGLLLFWRRFIKREQPNNDQCHCHIIHTKPVEKEPVARPKASLKEVTILGMASGITPCPMALAAMIAAFSLGKISSALGSLVIFSLGIGSVLVILGIILIKGSDQLVTKLRHFNKAPVYIAKASAIIVLLLGIYLVVKPLMLAEDDHSNQQAIQLFK